MARTFRRVVTGNDGNGRSVVVEDGPVAASGGAGNFEMWMSDPDRKPDALPPSVPFVPPLGTSIFRFFRVPPADKSMPAETVAEIADGFFAAVGDPWCRHDTSRDPLMHRTPTTDYIVLLSGSAALLLDEGEQIALKPFDAVVQRATNHSWINTGSEDAVFVAVMVGERK